MARVGLELVVVEGGWLEQQYLDVGMGLAGMVGWGMMEWLFSAEAELLRPVPRIGFLGEPGQ